jgi:hypothetical protein
VLSFCCFFVLVAFLFLFKCLTLVSHINCPLFFLFFHFLLQYVRPANFIF